MSSARHPSGSTGEGGTARRLADAAGRGLRTLVRLNPAAPTWPTALRASAAAGLAILVLTAAGRGDVALLTTTGTFAVLYGAGRPLRNRLRVLLSVAAGFVLAAAVGTQAPGHGLLAVILLTVVAAVATYGSNVLRPGPPGGYFFVLVAGVAGYTVETGAVTPLEMVTATATGALVAVPVGLADLLLRPAGPQDRAVAAAEADVEALVRSEPGTPAAAELAATAAASLHRAWMTLWSAGDTLAAGGAARERIERLQRARLAFAGRSPETVQPAVDAAAGPLGPPRARHLLAASLHQHSAAVQAAARAAVGVALAGLLGWAVGTEHAYWTMATAMLILHLGLDRRRSLVRGVHRLLGAAVGLGLFALLQLADLPYGGTVLVVIVVTGLVEVLIPRNYGFAVALITPLALTVATAAHAGPVDAVVTERLVDTILGLAVAGLVLATIGRASPVPTLRAQLVQVLHTAGDALDHIARGTVDADAGRAAQRDVAMALEQLGAVHRRARADDPAVIAVWDPLVRATTALGVAVLARCASARGKGDTVMGSSWRSWAFAGAVASGRQLDAAHVDALRADVEGRRS